MDFNQACIKAMDYFKLHLNLEGLSAASEGEESWFFSGGSNAKERIGSTIIAINKVNGEVRVVDMLSGAEFEKVRLSKPVAVYPEYLAE